MHCIISTTSESPFGILCLHMLRIILQGQCVPLKLYLFVDTILAETSEVSVHKAPWSQNIEK